MRETVLRYIGVLLICLMFVGPRLHKKITFEEEAKSVLSIEIALTADTTQDVEKFVKDIDNVLNKRIPPKYRTELNEALLFIGFTKLYYNKEQEEKSSIDFYISSHMILYKVAKEHDNKLRVYQILQVAEKCKKELPEAWKAYNEEIHKSGYRKENDTLLLKALES